MCDRRLRSSRRSRQEARSAAEVDEGSGDDSGDDEAAAAAEREREREEAEVQRLASMVWCDLCKDGGERVPIGDVIVPDNRRDIFRCRNVSECQERRPSGRRPRAARRT